MRLSTSLLFLLLGTVCLQAQTPSSASAAVKPTQSPAADPIPDGLKALATFDFGFDRKPIVAFDAAVQKQSPAERITTEKAMLEILANAETKPGAKDYICRWLGIFGSAQSAPALEKLLGNEKLGLLAVQGLLARNTPEGRDLVVRSLPSVPASFRPAVLIALGRTHSANLVPVLTKYVSDADAATASAAIASLTQIGTAEALQALSAAKVSSALENDWNWARLHTAFAVLRADPSSANGLKPLFVEFLHAKSGQSISLRLAAAEGLSIADPAGAWAVLEPLLKDENVRVRQEIAKQACTLPDPVVTSLQAGFAAYDPAVQLVLITNLPVTKPALSVSLIKLAVASTNPDLHLAGLRAYGFANQPSSVSVLLPFLAGSKDEADAASFSLGKLSEPSSDVELRSALTQSTGATKAALFNVLASRLDSTITETAFASTLDASAPIADAACQALTILAQGSDFPRLLELLPKVKSGNQRKSIEKALARTVPLYSDKDKAAEVLGQALKTLPADNRPAVIVTLASLGTPKATSELRVLLQAPSVDARKETIRALSSVRNDTADTLLLEAAKKGEEKSEKILALRGYIDSISAHASDDKKLEAFKGAYALALRDEDKDAIVSALKNMRGNRAPKLIEELTGVKETKPSTTPTPAPKKS